MQSLREQLLWVTRKLAELGLNRGTSGNASVRTENGFLVTPSGVEVDAMTPHDLVLMDIDGGIKGEGRPSSEWRFHRDILQQRPEIGAVIHTHSTYATTLSCLRRDIPAFHYMIAVAGGNSIRCAPYAIFGSQALSDAAIAALEHRRACLLSNHGMIAIGETIKQALDVAVEVESLSQQYLLALQTGDPHILSSQEMDEVLERFKGYGKWNKPI